MPEHYESAAMGGKVQRKNWAIIPVAVFSGVVTGRVFKLWTQIKGGFWETCRNSVAFEYECQQSLMGIERREPGSKKGLC